MQGRALTAVAALSAADLAMAGAVVLVTLWLGRGATPRAQATLWLSALLVSAAMFLPMPVLRALLPVDLLAALESAAGALAWSLPVVAHVIAFGWLALVLWSLRPDLRGWRAAALMLVLAVAAEGMQGLTGDREARLADVGVNLLGAGFGRALAIGATAWRRWWSARPLAEPP